MKNKVLTLWILIGVCISPIFNYVRAEEVAFGKNIFTREKEIRNNNESEIIDMCTVSVVTSVQNIF